MKYEKDDDEIDSEEEQAQLRKKKKKRFPFHAKVGGGLARRRADRYRGGGAVASKADGEMESPSEPNAPKGGAIKQKYQGGGRVAEHTVRSQYHGGPQRTRTRTVTSRFRDPHPVTGLESGGRITMGERKALPSSDFALPGKGTGPSGKGPGSYPIDTEDRARNALSRGAQHASPEKLATIKRKVKAKYPDIKVGGED